MLVHVGTMCARCTVLNCALFHLIRARDVMPYNTHIFLKRPPRKKEKITKIIKYILYHILFQAGVQHFCVPPAHCSVIYPPEHFASGFCDHLTFIINIYRYFLMHKLLGGSCFSERRSFWLGLNGHTFLILNYFFDASHLFYIYFFYFYPRFIVGILTLLQSISPNIFADFRANFFIH